jgi:hypothetical protein
VPTTPDDAYDVAPFRLALSSSGQGADELTWKRPPGVTVAAFDIYWFHRPGTGAWQYRVDAGEWKTAIAPPGPADNGLHRVHVPEPVPRAITIRGHDGAQPCIAPIVGLRVHRTAPPAELGTTVHNLGRPHQFLAELCRRSAGDPLALFDDLRPDLVTVLFSNDVRFRDADRFAANLRRLLERVTRSADALVITPFEQRSPREVHDAVTVTGSTTVSSPTARFLLTDHNAPVRGTNIAPGATIEAVRSTEEVTISEPATGSAPAAEFAIDGLRDATMQATYRAFTKAVATGMGCIVLDLYEDWAQRFGPGWDAAYAAGLMSDGLHPSQLGHDEIAARVCAVLDLPAGTTGAP